MLVSASAMSLTYIVTYIMSILSQDMLTLLSNCTVAISMVTNLLATLLIAHKLWLVIISSDVKVLFLLVESGAFFLGLQVSFCFCFHTHVNYATV
jgi:hypothetical protein